MLHLSGMVTSVRPSFAQTAFLFGICMSFHVWVFIIQSPPGVPRLGEVLKL